MIDQPIHVIVLTRDRPQIMQRCVHQMKLGSEDKLTILDDSSPAGFYEGRRLLHTLTNLDTCYHLSTDQIFSALKSQLPHKALGWMNRRATRDIAPLRNLSLLISVWTNSALTILVDDDITGFDLELTRQKVAEIGGEKGSIIAGAHIAGTDELGVIKRLERALYAFEAKKGCFAQDALKSLFQIPRPTTLLSPEPVKYVSGGYLAFALPAAKEYYVAFPPGYNEDWFWCIENGRRGVAKVFRLPQVVIHDPPCVREVTEEDVMFEILGNLIFDLTAESCIVPTTKIGEEHNSLTYSPSEIAKYLPTKSICRLIEKSRSCPNRDVFYDVGLRSLQRLFGNGMQMFDWVKEVNQWQIDSDRKQRSFNFAITAEKSQMVKLIYEDLTSS